MPWGASCAQAVSVCVCAKRVQLLVLVLVLVLVLLADAHSPRSYCTAGGHSPGYLRARGIDTPAKRKESHTGTSIRGGHSAGGALTA